MHIVSVKHGLLQVRTSKKYLNFLNKEVRLNDRLINVDRRENNFWKVVEFL